MVGLEVYLIKDTFAQQLLIIGPAALAVGSVILHLECARPYFVWDESVSLRFRLKIFFILKHLNYR